MDDPPNPPASSGSKTFGIHKFNPEYCLGARSGAQREDRRRGYEDKYEDDAMYEELGDDARIWRVMLDEGRANDAAMLQRFRDHLDVDLVFAGLFSAVLTTFVAQTSQAPSDTGDTTIALLLEIIAIQRAWANSPRVNDVASFSLPPPSPTPSPWINRCWFLSLIFSLLAAFGAVVVRQWLQEYESDITGRPKQRALVRHYRRVGLEKYKVHLIVPILPMLLHVSLLLFFIGLTLYVRQSDRSMSNGIIALTTMIYLVYLGTNLMPIFRPQCPYRSPLSTGAHWARSLVALLYFVLPARLRTKALLPIFLRSISSAASHVHALVVQLHSFRKALNNSWKEVFKAPDAHEWEAVLHSSDTMIPDSLDSMAQASSDLSITPLVVQASSSLLICLTLFGEYKFKDPRAQELLRRRILPWFINALRTRRTGFDWVPGRENELQRMACALLLVPIRPSLISDPTVLWKEIDTAQYCSCVSGVVQALTAALLDLGSTPTITMTDMATLSMTLLALGNRLQDLDHNSNLLQDGALFDTIATAYSSLSEPPSLAVLRLRPVIWSQALTYLCFSGRSMDKTAHFAIALWRSAYSEKPFPDGNDWRKEHLATLPRVTLQECLYLCPEFSESMTIAMHRLLCPQSCTLPHGELSLASRLHLTCHVIDLLVKEDNADGDAAFDENLGFLALQFVELLVTTLGFGSIESTLRRIGPTKVSATFKSTFLACPALLLTAKLWEADARLSATFAVSLFRLLVEVMAALKTSVDSDKQLAICDIIRMLNRHATEHYDALVGEIPIDLDHLRPAVEEILQDPALAVLNISDILAALLTMVLNEATSEFNLRTRSSMSTDNAVPSSVPSNQPADDMVWCLYLDALCAARANSELIDKKFSDASRKLHSALLSLKSTFHDTWKSELTRQLEERIIPLGVAFALKSTHGRAALAEWVDLPTLVQDPPSGLEVRVPHEVQRGDDLDWYRHFTSNPDQHIKEYWWRRWHTLPISELVSFEEAVKRMQKIDAERAAVEAQRDSHDDDAETDANNDAEGPGRVHGGLENREGAERTENEIIGRLKTFGNWGARPLKGVRPFLARIARPLRRGESHNRSSSMAPHDIESGGAGIEVAEGSGGGSVLQARETKGGLDGDKGEQIHDHDDGERRNGETKDNAQAQVDEQDRSGEQAQDDQQGQDDEQGQGEEVSHPQHSWTPEELEGVGAREDTEHGGGTSVREIPDAGRGSEQENGDEKRRDDEHDWDGDRDRDGEHSRAGEQGRVDENSQVGERGTGCERGHDDEEGLAVEVPPPRAVRRRTRRTKLARARR
ncbi:hypothetical protein EV715DRAFT_214152 [Schizophyllum commune]